MDGVIRYPPSPTPVAVLMLVNANTGGEQHRGEEEHHDEERGRHEEQDAEPFAGGHDTRLPVGEGVRAPAAPGARPGAAGSAALSISA